MEDTSTVVYVDRRPPAAQDNTTRFLSAGVVAVVALGLMGLVFWAMVRVGGTERAAPVASQPLPQTPLAEPAPIASQPAAEPEPDPDPIATELIEPVPPLAPASDELVSNQWVLSTYSVERPDGLVVVNGTVTNLSAEARSSTIRVYVYEEDVLIATAKGEVIGVPPGGTVAVSLPSGAPWAAGTKVLLMTAEDQPL